MEAKELGTESSKSCVEVATTESKKPPSVEERLASEEVMLANAKHGLVCSLRDGNVGCVALDGTVRIPFVYKWAIRFAESGFALTYNETLGPVYVNEDHSRVLGSGTLDAIPDAALEDIDPEFYSTGGYARVSENGLIGYMNEKSELVIPPRYEAANIFKDGRALVCVGCDPKRWAKGASEDARCTGDAFYVDQTGKRLSVEPELPDFEDCGETKAGEPTP